MCSHYSQSLIRGDRETLDLYDEFPSLTPAEDVFILQLMQTAAAMA